MATRFSKKKETVEERLARRGLAPEQLDNLIDSLEGVTHFKKIALNTQKGHDNVYKKWQAFAKSRTPAMYQEDIEIIMGREPPSESELRGRLYAHIN